MNPFGLKKAASVAEAIQLLETLEDAALYAGGTELLLVMKQGFLQPNHLIDVKGIPELQEIRVDPSAGYLRIGAAVTHQRVARDPQVQEWIPELAWIEGRIANIRVRSTGTIGGNLCFAEPHSDTATFSLLMDGRVGLQGRAGRREVPLDQFLVGPYETSRRPDEVMIYLEFPLPGTRSLVGYERLAIHERPTATGGVRLILDESRECVEDVRVAIGSIGPTPQRVPEAEELLRGCRRAQFAQRLIAAAETVAATVPVLPDFTGAEDYKRHLAGVVIQRAGEQAWSKWVRGEDIHV